MTGKNFLNTLTHFLFTAVFSLILLTTYPGISKVWGDEPQTPGLLFYLSGKNGFIPDVANDEPEPTFIRGVEVIPDGAHGAWFKCAHTQLMAYSAPGNIFAERGTLSFFWRSREPVGEVQFPIFRVGYSDHSSWDFIWLRIDYNGHGFDAFVTDANLARPRVSCTIPKLPEPDQWPGAALMGIEPEKITDSVLREMEAFYENEMFTNGLPTIQTDELHVYEEGINVLPQTMLLDYGDPKVIERLMKTAKAYEFITGINDLGHRHIRSSFYSGTKIAEESVWALAKTHYSHLILHPGLVLVEYNGHPAAKKLLLELADGLLAHGKKDSNGNYYLPGEILSPSGEGEGAQPWLS